MRLLRRLERIAPIDEMKFSDLKKYLTLLSQANTEEEFNDILNSVKEKK